MKEENLSGQVHDIENRYNGEPLTSPTLVNPHENYNYTFLDPSDQTSSATTGLKRGRPVKDITKWRPVKKSFVKKEWNDDETSLLIELWRNEEALYNTRSELHANKEERTKALERITSELQNDNIAVCSEQVSEKMTSLRCYYSGQMGKERASKTNCTDAASIFVSPWKFMKSMSFLESNYKPRNTEWNSKYGQNNGSMVLNSPCKTLFTPKSIYSNTNSKYTCRINSYENSNIHNNVASMHNGGILFNGTSSTQNNVSSSDDPRNDNHENTNNSQNVTNNFHNARNSIPNGINAYNGANNSPEGKVDIHEATNVCSNVTNYSHSTQTMVNSTHGSVNSPFTSTNSSLSPVNNDASNIHNGVDDTFNPPFNHSSNTVHTGAYNIQKDKEHQRMMMLNMLQQTGIMEVIFEKLSRESSKSSDESFGDLVISLLKEISNPEKKDKVKLEIHNLLVNAKYST